MEDPNDDTKASGACYPPVEACPNNVGCVALLECVLCWEG